MWCACPKPRKSPELSQGVGSTLSLLLAKQASRPWSCAGVSLGQGHGGGTETSADKGCWVGGIALGTRLLLVSDYTGRLAEIQSLIDRLDAPTEEMVVDEVMVANVSP